MNLQEVLHREALTMAKARCTLVPIATNKAVQSWKEAIMAMKKGLEQNDLIDNPFKDEQ